MGPFMLPLGSDHHLVCIITKASPTSSLNLAFSVILVVLEIELCLNFSLQEH